MSDRTPVVSEWRGHPRYGCPLCAFDSLEAVKVSEHIQWQHPVEEPEAAPVPAPAVTRATRTTAAPAAKED